MSHTFRMENGDLFIDPNTGLLDWITGPDKTAQDCGEILLTPLDQLADQPLSRSAVAFNRDFGSELASIEAPPEYGGIFGEPLVSKKIQESVSRLQTLQRLDPMAGPDERIAQISQLAVRQIAATNFIFYVEVTLESGDKAILANHTETQLQHQVLSNNLLDDRNKL